MDTTEEMKKSRQEREKRFGKNAKRWRLTSEEAEKKTIEKLKWSLQMAKDGLIDGWMEGRKGKDQPQAETEPERRRPEWQKKLFWRNLRQQAGEAAEAQLHVIGRWTI